MEYFAVGLCKNATYTVQIGIRLAEAVLGRKGETEWMLKLTIMNPYGLNEKVDTFEDGLWFKSDDLKVKRLKSDNGIVGKLLPSPTRLLKDQIFRHGNRKGMSNLKYNSL